MDRSQTRVVDPVAKQLRLGLVGFAVAAVGVTLGFLVDYGPDNPLAYGAFGLAAWVSLPSHGAGLRHSNSRRAARAVKMTTRGNPSLRSYAQNV